MFSFVTFQDDDAKPIKKKPAWIAYGENPDGTTGVFSGGQWDEQELASAKAKMEKELALVECHQDDDGWTSDDDEKPQNRTLLVLMGLPGAGKSSLTEELVKDMHKNHYVKPLKHVRLDGDLGSFIYLGHIRDKYPGTDALAYEHDPILDFLKEQPSNTLVYGEGARITSVNFLQKVQDLGYKVTVVKLDIDQKTGNMRCIMRDDKSFSDLHFQKLATVMQKIEKEFNFWSLSGVDSLIKNAKHLGQIIAQINGVEFKEKEEEKWTEQDEKNLTILQGLNSRPNAIAKIDYDIQLDLEAKKKRIEEKKKQKEQELRDYSRTRWIKHTQERYEEEKKKKPAWIAFDDDCNIVHGGDWDKQELAEEKEKMENELKKMGKGQGKGEKKEKQKDDVLQDIYLTQT